MVQLTSAASAHPTQRRADHCPGDNRVFDPAIFHVLQLKSQDAAP